ncbi:MAG: hypothetical protein ACREWG_00360 [Gammaproteobacteria bacterium]
MDSVFRSTSHSIRTTGRDTDFLHPARRKIQTTRVSKKKRPPRRLSPLPEIRAAKPSPSSSTVAIYRRWFAAGMVAVLAISGLLFYILYIGHHPGPLPEGEGKANVPLATTTTPAPSSVNPPAQYVGGQACIECHAQAYEAWRASHHDLAMQEANAQTVLGNFTGAKFSYAGITSTFFRRAGKFYVNTDGPDGKLQDFEIKYTFGVSPLQQTGLTMG